MDLEISKKVKTLKQKIKESDAIMIATFEYNYSSFGDLKNAIDWPSRFLGMFGTARVHYHLRQVFVFFDAHVPNQPEIVVPNAETKFDESGNLTDEQTKERLKGFIVFLRMDRYSNGR